MIVPKFMLTIALAAGALLLGGCASSEPRTFASPDAAVDTLVSALRAGDTAEVKAILGPESDEIISSGDPVSDHNITEKFLANYDEKHAFASEADGSKVLVVGENDWPMPIPLVKNEDTNTWCFDTAAGKDEIINRRIGRNELSAIEVCRAIADAEHEYATTDPNGDGIETYAAKFFSDPGKKNGLYWKTEAGQPTSPLGDLAAQAAAEGYSTERGGAPRPYHGYFYRIVTAQGPHATGGEMDYMVKGMLLGGFGVIAFPAEYGNSGIMTFQINQEGTVYEKDLGTQTLSAARAMKAFDPGPGWTKVE
jgi:hypothetical protein